MVHDQFHISDFTLSHTDTHAHTHAHPVFVLVYLYKKVLHRTKRAEDKFRDYKNKLKTILRNSGGKCTTANSFSDVCGTVALT